MHISRPRPSLNCTVCRRRKVRCGRERPVCANCVRLKEPCFYETFPGKNGAAKQDQAPNNTSPEEEDPKLGGDGGKDMSDGVDRPQRYKRPMNCVGEDSSYGRETHSIADLLEEEDVSLDEPEDTDMLKVSSALLAFSKHPPSNATAKSEGLKAASRSSSNSRSAPSVIALDSMNNWQGTGRKSEPGTPSQARPGSKQLGILNDHPPFRQHPRTPLKGDRVTPYTYAGDDSGYSSISASSGDQSCTGYLFSPKAVRPQYVESSFWALMRGQEHLCGEFLARRVSDPPVDAIGLWNLLKTLPTKAVCDALVYSFLIGVRPLAPLVDVPTFRRDYDGFWSWAAKCDTEVPDLRLLRDPTFFALLFSILYCGAIAAPISWWSKAPLAGMERDATVDKLHSSCSTCLNLCQYTIYPTLHSLVAVLLCHTCEVEETESLKEAVFISMIMRLAQSLGLHMEAKIASGDSGTSDLRRRVWWHIVWLDLRSSIRHGTRLCCDLSRCDVQMISERARNRYFTPAQRSSAESSPSEFGSDPFTSLTIGRYETARFQSLLLNELQNTRELEHTQIDRFLTGLKTLYICLDRLIAQVPADGFPERGHIPRKLADASPLINRNLYSGDTAGPSVFTSWVRVALSMLKLEAAILLQKTIMYQTDLEGRQSRAFWQSTVSLCTAYLRKFIYMLRVPAFSPYHWLSCTRSPPLSAILMILVYLQHESTSSKAQFAKYFVDEVIEVFSPGEITYSSAGNHWPDHSELGVSNSVPSSGAPSSDGENSDGVWPFIRKLRARSDYTNGMRTTSHDDFDALGTATRDSSLSALKPPNTKKQTTFSSPRPERLEPFGPFDGVFSARDTPSIAHHSVSFWADAEGEDTMDGSGFDARIDSLVQEADGLLGPDDLPMEDLFNSVSTDFGVSRHKG